MNIKSEKLKEKMMESCIDPKELCSKAEISYPTFKRALNQSNVKFSTVGKICRVLGCSPMELVDL